MKTKSKYVLSFTAASLRLQEMVKVATTANVDDITDLATVKESGVVFNTGKRRTTDREFREIRQRLKKLSPEQRDILIRGDLNSQKQIAFLAVCKHYTFIRDFTIEVIRDKVLVFDYQLHESDYASFISSKTLLHPELDGFSESTRKKAKQVMFRILEQAGIINNPVDKMIQPQILHQDVINAIVWDDTEWLKIFMMPDQDIKQLRN